MRHLAIRTNCQNLFLIVRNSLRLKGLVAKGLAIQPCNLQMQTKSATAVPTQKPLLVFASQWLQRNGLLVRDEGTHLLKIRHFDYAASPDMVAVPIQSGYPAGF